MEKELKRCFWANPDNPLYLAYHDDEWGEPCHDERMLFGIHEQMCTSLSDAENPLRRKTVARSIQAKTILKVESHNVR